MLFIKRGVVHKNVLLLHIVEEKVLILLAYTCTCSCMLLTKGL